MSPNPPSPETTRASGWSVPGNGATGVPIPLCHRAPQALQVLEGGFPDRGIAGRIIDLRFADIVAKHFQKLSPKEQEERMERLRKAAAKVQSRLESSSRPRKRTLLQTGLLDKGFTEFFASAAHNPLD